MARIAVGGMQHETNTFAPSKADYGAFEAGGGWPAVQYGESVFGAVEGANIPAAGAIQALRAQGHQLVATAWGAASPSAQVTTDAFERIVGELISRLKKALPVDGVYLDLHGAMVTEALDDGEGEILRRVRAVVGPRVPIAASLDLHCNFTRAMFELSDALVAYRTYPHIDMADTGARAAALLDAMLRAGKPLAKHWRALDYLTGLPSQCSFIDPCKTLYEDLGRDQDVTLSFTPGFPMADFPECGMAVFVMVLMKKALLARWTGCGAWCPMPRKTLRSSCTCPTTRWRARAATANLASRWCSPIRRTIPAQAATATPRGC